MFETRKYLAPLLSVSLLALAVPLSAQTITAADTVPADSRTPPAYGGFGVDLSGRDLSVKPGDDFERYASGKWLDAATIPADRAAVGSGEDLDEAVQAEVRDLIIHAAPDSKIGALYTSFLDEARIEARGNAPLMADIARVRAIHTKEAFARYMGGTGGVFGISLYGLGVSSDPQNPGLNVLEIDQDGLGMPNRNYYLDAQFKPQRDAYTAYVEKVLRAIDEPNPAGATSDILAFETELARVSWAAEDRRDLARINNHYTTSQLADYAPGVDWAAYFDGAGIAPQKTIWVTTDTAVRDMAALFAKTPLATLKAWEEFHVAYQASPYLGKAMVDARFGFRSTLYGVTAISPRWKRGVYLVSGSLGEMVGQAYVDRYFTPAAKAKMEALVANLKAAMGARIRASSWMGADTKLAALDKLARMTVMVGYPDKPRDYTGLSVDSHDLYGNSLRAGRFNNAYEMAELGKPVDRTRWNAPAQTVNAFNESLQNQIVFPAGILQPPFFDSNADDAVNYGAIGAIIGHEISHGFDDQGRKIDATGALRDWWTPQDAARFDAEAKAFGEQYAKIDIAPGVAVNPKLTMGENIADFAGVQVALDAYHVSLGGKPAPVLEGLTGDQRFFLAFAQAWRSKVREAALRSQVATDPHSPARVRVLVPLANVDAFYAAFDVKPGDKMYIPPEKRAHIW